MLIDLLFLDVRMPHMDGTEFLRRAREDRPEIPAIFSSGFIPEEQESQDLFDRVVYLPKPYRIPDLLACVDAALSLSDDSWGANTTLNNDSAISGWESIDSLGESMPVPTGPGVSMDAAATIQGVEALAPITSRKHRIGPKLDDEETPGGD